MQSRRDQVQAYFFTVGRLVSALMRGRPDDRTTPTRRFAAGAVVGVLIAAVVTAGFGVLGALKPGASTAWQQEGVVTVEQETGARYVTLGGVLHPALNYSSALLASDEDYQQPVTVSQQSLRNAPRGAPLGIPGAPDSLPDPTDPAALDRAPWTVCTTGDGRSAQLRIGGPAGRALDDGEGLLVSTADSGPRYLVWRGGKLRVPGRTAAQLGNSQSPPFRVTAEWINAIPSAGPDLTAPTVPGVGSTTTSTADGKPAAVGTVYEVTNRLNRPQQQYFVQLPDGLLPVNKTTAGLVISDPRTAAAYPGSAPAPVRAAPSLLTGPRSKTALPPQFQKLPDAIDRREPGSQDGPCASFDVAGRGNITLTTAPPPPPGPRAAVPPGAGVLLHEQAVPGGPPGNTYLVDQLGVKYPLIGGAQDKLGYRGRPAVTVPSSLLNMLPRGTALDPARAQRPHHPEAQPAGS